MIDRNRHENAMAKPPREVRVFRTSGALADLSKPEIAAQAKSIIEKNSRESAMMKQQDTREEWLIHQSAPGLIDDRGNMLLHKPQAKARANFQNLFTTEAERSGR